MTINMPNGFNRYRTWYFENQYMTNFNLSLSCFRQRLLKDFYIATNQRPKSVLGIILRYVSSKITKYFVLEINRSSPLQLLPIDPSGPLHFVFKVLGRASYLTSLQWVVCTWDKFEKLCMFSQIFVQNYGNCFVSFPNDRR